MFATNNYVPNQGGTNDIRLRKVERGFLSFKQDICTRLDGLEDVLRSRLPVMAHQTAQILSSRTPAESQSHVPASAAIPNLPVSCISGHVTLPAAAIDSKDVATVKLGDEEFVFDRTTVADPPAKHFSDDIDGLFEQWNNSNLLVVNGRGIPIKYWPQFYQAKKGFKSGAWKAIRVEWGNWKVSPSESPVIPAGFHVLVLQFIVEEREKHASNKLFWAKFSDTESGVQFGFQQILTSLKHERMEHDAQAAADALQFFNRNLGCADANGAFSYTSRTGGTVVMSKTGDIARNWRNLLAQDPSIAAQWYAR